MNGRCKPEEWEHRFWKALTLPAPVSRVAKVTRGYTQGVTGMTDGRASQSVVPNHSVSVKGGCVRDAVFSPTPDGLNRSLWEGARYVARPPADF